MNQIIIYDNERLIYKFCQTETCVNFSQKKSYCDTFFPGIYYYIIAISGNF